MRPKIGQLIRDDGAPMRKSKALSIIAGLAVFNILAAPDAEAGKRTSGHGSVTGCSRFGHGCVSGAVRNSGAGAEVRLPGGTWLNCARDCRDKLAAETVDFWDLHRPERPK